MLVKIIFNEKEYLIVLHQSTFEEFLLKTKKILKLEQSRKISVTFSGCNVSEDIFNEVLQSFGENKQLISFVIGAETELTKSPVPDVYTHVDYLLSELEDNQNVVDIHAPGKSQETCSVTDSTAAVVTNVQIIDRRLVVNPLILSCNFEGIFEVGKMMGMIRSGFSLENKHRVEVSKAVIKKVLELAGLDYIIKTVDFKFLSQKLEAIFNDPAGIYYIPAVEGCPARGILLHVFCSQRTALAKSSVIVRRKKVRRLAIDTELTAEGNVDYQEVIGMFGGFYGDGDELVDLWESTRTVRLQMWQSKTSGLKISDIFESFPCLADRRTDSLILNDLEHLFPNSKASYIEWENNYKKVLNQARNFRDLFAKNIISQIDFMDDIDDKMVSSLLLIPYIMPPNGRRTSKGEAASKSDIQDSFISVYDDLAECNDDGDDSDYHLRFLKDNNVITYACYKISSYSFKYQNPMDALLGLFAKMIVFNIKFPNLCNHVWQFIQQGIFGIPVENAVACHTAQVALKLSNL